MRIQRFSLSAYTARKDSPQGFGTTPIYDQGDAAAVLQYEGAAPASTEAIVRAREIARIRKDHPALTLAEAQAIADARTATARRGGASKRPGPCFARPDLVLAANG